MTRQSTRFPEVIVFKIKGLRATPVFKLIVDTVLADTSHWIGPATCVPVFRMEVVRPGETTDLPWTDRFIPYDNDAIERLLLSSDDIESIQHKRNFLPDEQPKPRPKPKQAPKGPFSKQGYNLDGWSPCWHPYFDRPELDTEGAELGRLLNGYPFADKSPTENARYVEMEIIHRLRDRFPTIYELEKLNKDALTEALKLIAKPAIQRFGSAQHFKLAHAYHERQIPNMIGRYLSHLQDLDRMIKNDRINDRDRKIVDPTDDEASTDKYFLLAGGSNNDRDSSDELADAEAEEEALNA